MSVSGEKNPDYVRKRVPMSEETRQSLLGSEHETSDEDYAPSPPQKRGKSLFKPPKKKGPTAGQAALAAVAEGVKVATGGSQLTSNNIPFLTKCCLFNF